MAPQKVEGDNGNTNGCDEERKPIPFDDALRKIVQSPPKHRTSDSGSLKAKKPTKSKPKKTR